MLTGLKHFRCLIKDVLFIRKRFIKSKILQAPKNEQTFKVPRFILDTYSVRYPHAIAFLKFSCHFRAPSSNNPKLKFALFYSYCTHVLPFQNMPWEVSNKPHSNHIASCL